MAWMSLLLWTSVCLVAEGFFSGSELALVSADKVKLAHRSARGNLGSKMALTLARKPDWFFSATLLGQNLFIVANSVLVTFFIFNHYGPEYEWLGLLLSPLILIFGEAVPKSLAQQWADQIAPKVAPIIFIFSYLFFPLVWGLSKLTLLLLGGVRGSLLHGHEVTHEYLEMLLRDAETPRELAPIFKQSLLKILKFAKKEVREVMTPLVEVFSIRKTALVEEAILLCQEEGYSSVPIFQNRSYNIVGVVRFSDLLFAKDLKAPVGDLTVPPLYVPLQIGVKDLLLILRNQQKDFAVVVDEYGTAAGIVTLEDIVEEILGEIEDEYDETKTSWRRLDASHFLLEGRISIDKINEKLHWGLPKGNYETLAGFLLAQAGYFPKVGDILRFGDLTFLIKTATPRSIDQVLVELE